MCGRYGINKDQQELEQYFNAPLSPEAQEVFRVNHDVRPSTDVLVITSENAQTIDLVKMEV